MSEWDEKAAQSAWERNPWAGSLAKSIRTAEVDGAAWQREALLSDEAVERAANVLYNGLYVGTLSEHEAGCERRDCNLADQYRTLARAALTAALGIESKETP